MVLLKSSISLLIFAHLLSGCTQLIFQPMSRHVNNPLLQSIQVEDVFFNTEDGERLHAWLLPAATPQPKASIIFFHGNAQNISTHVGAVYWLPAQGYQVLLVDYRGYGKSSGKVDLSGAIMDINSTLEYGLQNILGNEPLILMGQSLGASMLIYASSQSPHKPRISAVLLISAFSDYQLVARELLATSWLTWWLQWPLSLTINNDYRPVEFIADIAPVPVYLLHGSLDQSVNPEHSRILFSHAKEPKYFYSLAGGHNNLFAYLQNHQIILDILRQIHQQ